MTENQTDQNTVHLGFLHSLKSKFNSWIEKKLRFSEEEIKRINEETERLDIELAELKKRYEEISEEIKREDEQLAQQQKLRKIIHEQSLADRQLRYAKWSMLASGLSAVIALIVLVLILAGLHKP